MRMRFSALEIKELLKAWIAISLMFALAFAGLGGFLIALPAALLTAGVGFLLHELGHKFVAQRYGLWAEFRANNQMLITGLLLSPLGLVFAAPGGVYMNRSRHEGKIALAGPLINVILAVGFAIGALAYQNIILQYGWMINAWLAAFNMIPFPPFDGANIVKWNKLIYGLVLAGALVLTFFSFL